MTIQRIITHAYLWIIVGAVLSPLSTCDGMETLLTAAHLAPYMQRVVFKKKVPWCKSKSISLLDYAQHYQTSRFFISRTLTKKRNYFTRHAREGDVFWVLNPDRAITFYLLVNTKTCSLSLLLNDEQRKKRFFLARYPVVLARPDLSDQPCGTYSLGASCVPHKPHIFGTRWMPFIQLPGSKGLLRDPQTGKRFGIHGIPMIQQADGTVIEDKTTVGQRLSGGCVRMRSEDIEELCVLTDSRQTIVEIK